MNTKLIRNILIALCLCCISCGNSSAISKGNAAITKEDVSHIVDSINVLSKEIVNIKEELSAEIGKIEKKQNAKEKNQVNKWLVYSWLTVLTGIIAWLVYCWNKVPEKEDLKKLEHNVEKLRNKIDLILRKQEQNLSKKISNNYDNENNGIQIQQILERLLVVEKTIKESSSKNKQVLESIQESSKEGYFGIVKGYGIFNDIFYSKKDECKFKVWFKNNDKEAEFDLIDLKRIKSFDGIETAVHFDTSEVSLQEASSYETIKRGLVIKIGDIWEIKQKVSVLLKK